jgi:PAS domain S-box-containing protein
LCAPAANPRSNFHPIFHFTQPGFPTEDGFTGFLIERKGRQLTWLFRKRKEASFEKKLSIPFFEWAARKDLFSSVLDPVERTQKLLAEIQKRSLADQVFLLSWDTSEKTCTTLASSPPGTESILDETLQFNLLHKVLEKKQVLFWEDVWKDDFVRHQCKKSNCNTFLFSPLIYQNDVLDVLVIVNYALSGTSTRIIEFISLISTVLALSLQNFRMYHELKQKNEKLTDWTDHVEKRIKDGTKHLLERELQYYALFESANDGILVHDCSGRILEANQVACKLLGYGKKDLLDQTWEALTHLGQFQEQEAYFNRSTKKEKSLPLETVLKRKNGETFFAELSSRKVLFKGDECIQTFIREVTLRKQLEEGLKESRERYRLLFESSLMGVFILKNGVIQLANGMFSEITGFTREELQGQNFFDRVVPEDRSMVASRESRREKGEAVPDQYEIRFVHKNGEKRWADIRSCRIVLDGEAGVLCNLIDITQHKQMEMQLLESQKMESIGTLAGGIAHDFNNLLGGILGYASLILCDMKKDNPYYEDIHTIAETAKRAADLTNRLLAFARGGKYRVTSINANQIAKDMLIILSHSIDRSIAIETHFFKNLWSVKGDAQQIHQAMLNICLNAIDAMPGGGKLTLSTDNLILDESFAQTQLGLKSGDYVRINIVDTGLGMDDKTKSRIFEPFFTTKPSSGGKGLGLSMVYGIVKNHDGCILVDSEIGKGTKMTLFFPRFVEETPQVALAEIEDAGAKQRILLIDDEDIIRQVGKRMLIKGGYEVQLAKNGAEALEFYRIEPHAFDLVLLDLIMPEMDGKEIYHKLKEINPDVRVVFTSGYGPQDRPELAQIDNAGFIQKPFQTEILLQTVQGILKN